MSMETRQDENEDSSAIFWPGYVDATTNLILNLLFLLMILIIAVFMFALELGSKLEVKDPPITATKPAEEVLFKSTTDPIENKPQLATVKEEGVVHSREKTDSFKENIELKREVKRLKMMLKQRGFEKLQYGGPVKHEDDATKTEPKPLRGLNDVIEKSSKEILVHFWDEAIKFKPAEHDQLLKTLKPVVKRGKAAIYVEVPAGFSEAKRMGFYRAMAVRNLLIEMKMPKENIDISVVEGKDKANASLVRVR